MQFDPERENPVMHPVQTLESVQLEHSTRQGVHSVALVVEL